MIKFLNFEQIYSNENNLIGFKSLMEILDDLNKILINYLPNNVCRFARVGAYDSKDNLVVIFVCDQQILTTVKNSSESLIRLFNKNNYNIEKILIKVSMNFKFIDNNFEKEIDF